MTDQPTHTPNANVGISPRGYAMRIPDVSFPTTHTPDHQVRIDALPEADSVIQFLWTDYYKSPHQKRLEHVMSLSVRLAQIIGDLKDWLWVNYRHNESLYGMNLDFLKDCLLYAQTGHRKMSIRTWYELILETPENDNKDLKDRPQQLADVEIPQLDELLANWVSHPGGIDDLFFASFILFGKVENG